MTGVAPVSEIQKFSVAETAVVAITLHPSVNKFVKMETGAMPGLLDWPHARHGFGCMEAAKMKATAGIPSVSRSSRFKVTRRMC
jgi:hypothetical protein